MRGFLNLLSILAILTVLALVTWCIGATATGDGMTGWEDHVAFGITLVLLGLVGVGRLLEIVTGEDKRR